MSSSTFKYLDQSNGQGSDAAQDFLNKKMSGNKYMSVSNPDNPYSMGEGTTPDGTAYPGSKASIAAASSGNSSSGDSDSPMGSMTADEVRERFNLKYDEATAAKMDNKALGMNKKGTKTRLQNDAGHMWYEENGEQKYLGKIRNTRGNINNQEGESKHEGADKNKLIGADHVANDPLLRQIRGDSSNGFNTINDVAGTMRKLIESPSQETAAAPVKEATPIEHSPEIRQAKERVQSYETDVLSGKTSEEIFGKGEQLANDKYQLDLDQGADGIGANPSSNSQQAAQTATGSFLDKKVFDVKSKKSFQPTS